jgi:hypothetical protein
MVDLDVDRVRVLRALGLTEKVADQAGGRRRRVQRRSWRAIGLMRFAGMMLPANGVRGVVVGS